MEGAFNQSLARWVPSEVIFGTSNAIYIAFHSGFMYSTIYLAVLFVQV